MITRHPKAQVTRPAPRRMLGVAAMAMALNAAAMAQAQAQETDPPQNPQQAANAPLNPLSAIDWLRDDARRLPGAYPVTPPAGGSAGSISVRALDALRPEAVGLFPAARVGLPETIWGPTPGSQLAELIAALPADMLPALRDMSYRLLLAEFAAPLPDVQHPVRTPLRASADPGDSAPVTLEAALPADLSAEAAHTAAPDFLLARIDKLVEFGALDQAAALLDPLGSDAPVLRLRRFDIGLLLGDEDRVCETIIAPPPVGDDAAMIFCLARSGDWPAAAQLHETARDEGRLTPYMADLLDKFLHDDPTLPGSATILPPPPGTPDPLTWRLLEAVGDAQPSLGMPVAYAHADLRGTQGWRTQIEAAERLTRAGAMAPNRLLGLYTERSAAASGGIWERVREVQRLDAALRDGDGAAASEALLAAWPLIQAGELEVAMATLFSQPLQQLELTPQAARVAFRAGLLSENYETVALGLDPERASAEERFLAAIARGMDPAEAGRMPGQLAGAVAVAFGPEPPVSDEMADRLAEGRLGEVILRILADLGGPGDPRVLANGLASLRALGLEDIARRTALESLLLERNG
ncbi:hypothetical protein JI664_04760 [Rhodobacter sp. NTK016B]|uniref:hypothetical protein n=1 Tax=Rhodobacter sp. NTK016B TaxID=2759676 RepID=UPI001A8FF3C6|nr:hypothetical protein [Rhodobacter sp. NTK016B]MBN8291269.1 hypothetical protein [Rhodobacter sp. NTK016B]